MAHNFLLLLLTLAVMHAVVAQPSVDSQVAQPVDYKVEQDAGLSAGNVRFAKEIGTDYSIKTLRGASDFIWKVFQQTNPSDRKNISKIKLVIGNIKGEAFASHNEIHINEDYLGSYSGDLKREFAGVVYHEATHVWQWNGNGQANKGLVEGIADFVRLKANLASQHWVQDGEGDRWDQGYDVTARFLDYCNNIRDGFVAELNKKMKTGYSDDFFIELMGKNVHQLWEDYKAIYGK